MNWISSKKIRCIVPRNLKCTLLEKDIREFLSKTRMCKLIKSHRCSVDFYVQYERFKKIFEIGVNFHLGKWYFSWKVRNYNGKLERSGSEEDEKNLYFHLKRWKYNILEMSHSSLDRIGESVSHPSTSKYLKFILEKIISGKLIRSINVIEKNKEDFMISGSDVRKN